MITGEPSQTALMTAVQRGHHYHFAPEPKVLRDNLALALSGVGTPQAAQGYIDKMVQAFSALSDLETARAFMAQIDGAVCMRSRVVEEELASARGRAAQQLVILGAGLDTTAYRCTALTKDLELFEVDHPATQKWKRERLSDAEINVPENVTFVAFDFENQTLDEALAAGGVAQDKITFFTWLGVHMYLTDAAVRATLTILGRYPKGSELIMDFMSPSYVIEGEIEEKSVADLQAIVTQMGEPILSRYYEHELEDILKSSGFSNVNYLNARWLIDNYLGGKRHAFDMPDAATSILTATI